MDKSAGAPTRGTGFGIEGVASAGGKVGGKISRRPRNIEIGQPLTSQEMLFMADGVSVVVCELTNEDTPPEKVERWSGKAVELLVSGKWHLVFTETGESPLVSLSKWKKFLLKQWKKGHELLEKGTELTDDENEWLRSLRNVSQAYDVANKTKTKWTQESKKLA